MLFPSRFGFRRLGEVRSRRVGRDGRGSGNVILGRIRGGCGSRQRWSGRRSGFRRMMVGVKGVASSAVAGAVGDRPSRLGLWARFLCGSASLVDPQANSSGRSFSSSCQSLANLLLPHRQQPRAPLPPDPRFVSSSSSRLHLTRCLPVPSDIPAP
jgi:hypothetical protein